MKLVKNCCFCKYLPQLSKNQLSFGNKNSFLKEFIIFCKIQLFKYY